MTSLLYLVRPTHALIGCDSCITNKASPAFSSLQRWMSPAWKALTRPFKKPEFSEVLNWDSVTTQAHQRTILCHQWLHMEMRRPCSDQNTFLMEVMGSLHGVFLFGWVFLWSRSYAEYSCPESQTPKGTLPWASWTEDLSNLILLPPVRQKGKYLFQGFSLLLCPLWANEQMTESFSFWSQQK